VGAIAAAQALHVSYSERTEVKMMKKKVELGFRGGFTPGQRLGRFHTREKQKISRVSRLQPQFRVFL
jgi:hypothetical protein